MEERNLAVMFTDMKGFTSESSRRSRSQISRLLEHHAKITNEVVNANKGTIVKSLGDGFLITFDSPTNALHAAKALQENIKRHNKNVKNEDKFELRTSIAAGDVMIKDNDVFGPAVNVASRILAITQPGEIYFTESVYLLINKNEIPVAPLGKKNFKGVPETIRIYRVETSPASRIKTFFRSKQNMDRVKYGFLVLVFLFAASGVFAAYRNAQLGKTMGVAGAEDVFTDGVNSDSSGSDNAENSSSQDSGSVILSPSPSNQGTQTLGVQGSNVNSGSPSGSNNTGGQGQGGGSQGGGNTPTGGNIVCRVDGKCNGQETYLNCSADCPAPTPPASTPTPPSSPVPSDTPTPGGGSSGGGGQSYECGKGICKPDHPHFGECPIKDQCL